MTTASAQDLSEFEKDPRLFLFTSLTAGSSHIITATSRMETILKANKIPFQAIDTATDEKARRLWQRRARGKKLPGLVKDGLVIGDLEEVEDWNEFGELKENIGPVPTGNAPPAGGVQGVNIRPGPAPAADLGTSPNSRKSPDFDEKPSESQGVSSLLDKSNMIALPGAAEIAERNKAKSTAASTSSPIDEPPKVESMTSAPAEKQASINFAQEKMAKEHPSVDHLSAPPSAVQSGTATPEPELATEAEKVDAELAPSTSPSTEAEAASRKHRGSDVREAPIEEIRKIESESALQEEEDEEDGTKEVTKGVESVDVKDGNDESVSKVDGPEVMQQ